MSQQTISVIVPVFNAGKYLEPCLQSIIGQHYADLEVLLVDDGSTDGSGALCDWYAQKDGRIRVLHGLNGGAAHARNLGLDACTGSRIEFLDADDTLPLDHITTMDAVMQQQSADIVIAGVRYVPGPTIQHAPALWNTNEALEKLLYRDGVGDYPISKLYRREMFTGVRFVEGITSEDFEVFYRLFHKAKRIAVTDATTYYYRQNAHSVTNGGFKTGFFNRLDICEQLIQAIQQDRSEILQAAYSRAVDESIWLYGITPCTYVAQRSRMRDMVRHYAPMVRRDPKVSTKVRRKLAIFTLCPLIWVLRMRCKALLIYGYTKIKG